MSSESEASPIPGLAETHISAFAVQTSAGGWRQTVADVLGRPAFSAMLLLGALVIGVSGLHGLTQDRPEPWGRGGSIVTGELDLENLTVTRRVDQDGYPIIDSANPPMHLIRCGPTEPVEVVSKRFYFVGAEPEDFQRSEGSGVPFLFGPLEQDPRLDPGCSVVSFDTVPIDPELAGDEPVSFRLDVSDVEGFYLTVSVRSEQMVFDPGSVGTLETISIPEPE